MKLIQINGWNGRLNGPLARFIKAQSPDIVCLQEATRPAEYLYYLQDQYGFLDETKEAGNFDHEFFSPALGLRINGVTVDIGNAILSKLQLGDTKAIHTNNSYYVFEAPKDVQPNTRVLQSASIELNGKKVYVANHQGHLSGEHAQGDKTSVEKMKLVAKQLAALPYPLIFCGDLNVNSDTPTIAKLAGLGLINLIEKHGVKSTLSEAHRAPKADRESVACDYIFVSPEVRVKDFYVSEEIVSDHKALVLEFDI